MFYLFGLLMLVANMLCVPWMISEQQYATASFNAIVAIVTAIQIFGARQ